MILALAVLIIATLAVLWKRAIRPFLVSVHDETHPRHLFTRGPDE